VGGCAMSDVLGAKAISLLENDGITELPAHLNGDSDRVFRARGSRGDVYTVVVGAGRDFCSCHAGRRGARCYHARAARLFMARERSGIA